MNDVEKTAESWSNEMRKGYTKLAVLMFLNKKNQSGYEIMKEIENETLGFWKPTSGGMYPILKELEKKKYINGTWTQNGERKKKIYKITKQGKSVLENALQKQQQIAETIGELFRQFAKEVLETEISGTPPNPLQHFPFGKNLQKKPKKEQIFFLKKQRSHMSNAIKIIDKKLKKLE